MLVRTPYDLAAVIRQARLDAGLTQAQLAEKVGVSRLWVVKFEQGKAEAEIGLALRALRVLGLSLQIAGPGSPIPDAGAPAAADSTINLDDLLAGGES